jgi:DeoR family fructose operon transcriptional repressor
LRESGKQDVADLARTFQVSEMTIRRHLEALEAQGLCRRFHGGAEAVANRGFEVPFALRSRANLENKRAIGHAVAEAIPAGSTVYVDVGTTTLEVARALKDRSGLTILTPSLRVASLLADQVGIRTVCLGGVVRPGERSMVGPITQRIIEEFYLDMCILGVGGIDAESGVTEYNLDDASTKRAVVARSRHVLVAADATKVGATSFAYVSQASVVSTLITDAAPDDPALSRLEEIGVVCRSVGGASSVPGAT